MLSKLQHKVFSEKSENNIYANLVYMHMYSL